MELDIVQRLSNTASCYDKTFIQIIEKELKENEEEVTSLEFNEDNKHKVIAIKDNNILIFSYQEEDRVHSSVTRPIRLKKQIIPRERIAKIEITYNYTRLFNNDEDRIEGAYLTLKDGCEISINPINDGFSSEFQKYWKNDLIKFIDKLQKG
ncbi:hypothetical protein ACE1TI_07430 [Alteribacillus sp. JSM 102045]|uniref:hypothetical protein n=1 Tax=Alteribacillus sp. JSM 102045 TaxID=1562101 RepID=UPI0035BF3AE8